MKKKNIFEHKSIKKLEKSKKLVQPNDNSSMNYLVYSKTELEKIKNDLNIQLQNLSKRVNEASNHQPIKNDPVIKQLEEIQKQAKTYDFFELQKKIILTLGQRILKLQVENKRWQIQQKRIKKQQIEETFFRHKKIKKFDYQKLIQQKLQQNSYIARPYSSGKGFVESDKSYRQLDDVHVDRLQQCWFLDVIKEVNKMYMNIYSTYTSSSNSNQAKTNKISINIILFLCVILFIFGVIILASNIQNMEYCLMADVILIMLFLCLIGIKNYFQKPDQKNQLQQAKYDISAYFDKINKMNGEKGRRFTWICPQNFMYIEVHFQIQ